MPFHPLVPFYIRKDMFSPIMGFYPQFHSSVSGGTVSTNGFPQPKPTPSFQHYYTQNTQKFEKDFIRQLDALTELIYYEFDGGYWGNEFGSISSNFYEEEKSYDFMENGYSLRFFPSESEEDIVYFKILPVHVHPQIEVSFLQSNEKKYDGFICSHSKHHVYQQKLLPPPIPHSFCHYDEALKQYPMVVYLSSTTH